MPEQYLTVTTSIQKLLPLCGDWLQHRSHRLCLKKAAMLIFLSMSNRRRAKSQEAKEFISNGHAYLWGPRRGPALSLQPGLSPVAHITNSARC
jgi:hypothetical protein